MNSYNEKTLNSVTNAIISGNTEHRAYKAFANWAQYGVTAEQYTAVLPWLFDNDRDDNGQTVKGIGLVVPHEWIDRGPGEKCLFKQTGPAEIHRITYGIGSSLTWLTDAETGYKWNNADPRYTVENVVNGVIVTITEKAE